MGIAQLKNDAHDLITCMMQESTLIKDKSSLVNALLSYYYLIIIILFFSTLFDLIFIELSLTFHISLKSGRYVP